MNKFYLTLLLFVPLLSIAQSNYKSGYVVNLKGDTTRGYIDLKEWGNNPANINFKPSLNDKTAQLGVRDISYFEIDGYVSYSAFGVSVSTNSVDVSSPASISDTTSTTDSVFLKRLQTGKSVSLYVYRDKLKERFYIKDNTMSVPTELIYGIYQNPNNSNGVVAKNTFHNQLTQIAYKYNATSEKLINKIQQSGYAENDLLPIITEINGNNPTQVLKKPASNNHIIRFFGGAAFASNTLKYSANSPYYGVDPSKSSSPKITIGIDGIANPDVGHLIFRLELTYTTNKYTFNEKANPIYNEAYPELRTIKLKQNDLAITPQVLYNVYNADMLKVFIDVGYTVNIVSYPTDQIITYQKGQVIKTSNGVKNDPDYQNTYSAFQFKTGIVLNKRIEVYGSYFPAGNLSNSQMYSLDLTTYQVGVNYIFQ